MRSYSIRAKGYGTYCTGAAFTSVVLDVVLIVEPERIVQPLVTPPLPAEASTLTCPSQKSPNSLLDPVAHVVKTSIRIPYGKVDDPAA